MPCPPRMNSDSLPPPPPGPPSLWRGEGGADPPAAAGASIGYSMWMLQWSAAERVYTQAFLCASAPVGNREQSCSVRHCKLTHHHY